MKSYHSILKTIILPWLAMLPMAALCQCVLPFEAGNWSNNDAATRGITRIQVGFSCNDVILCGVDEHGNVHCEPPGPPFTIHLWGKCHPTDCDWGSVPGSEYLAPDGTRWIHAFYNQGFARRYVYIKPSSLFPGNLFLWMYTDFSDPARADYITTSWYHH